MYVYMNNNISSMALCYCNNYAKYNTLLLLSLLVTVVFYSHETLLYGERMSFCSWTVCNEFYLRFF